MSADCSRRILSGTTRRGTFVRCCIAIVSRPCVNTARPERGGNASNFGNICLRFQRISCVSLEARALADIFARHGEGRTDRDRRHGNASVAGHDVSRRSSRPTQRACTYLRQNAEALHSHRPRRQSFRRAFAVRSNKSPHHFSRTVIRLLCLAWRACNG